MPRAPSLSKAIAKLSPDQTKQVAALIFLLILAALAIAGPTGLLSWNENANVLEERTAHIAALSEKRDELSHLNTLLDLNGTDPDLAGELIRQNLNVVHPDEIVITLGKE
ncbi:MAG: septum formation initiator family protein [Erythrobacter sp.]